ncbi:MAG: nitrous oxide reductase family maturation protein NosD [Polyangiaceae bacterium]
MKRSLPPMLVCLACLIPGTAMAKVWVAGRDAPTVQGCVDLARPGDVVEVPTGVWRERIAIAKAITLKGRGGVIDGGGEGTVLRIRAAKVQVLDLVLSGSGSDLGAPDACVFLEKTARAARLQGNTLQRCAFGIWVNEAERTELIGNRIVGSTSGHRSNRGNSIHLFNASHLVVRGNTISGGRDGIYVSAVEDSLIEANTFEQCRYGVHYMYSYRNTLRGNVGRGNTSGYALMGSQYIKAIGNLAIENEERGILLRDVEHCTIKDNQLARNGMGFFIYSSTHNEISGNWVAYNDVGVKLWAGSLRNQVTSNAFVANRTQVFYVPSADLELGMAGPGNYWSDYTGWDQNNDGIGDRPYRLDSFTTNLTHRFPAAALLLRSPTLELLSHLEQTMPVFRVPTVIDRSPLLANPIRDIRPEARKGSVHTSASQEGS